MLNKSRLLSVSMLAFLFGTQAMPAFAQATAPTNWEANQQNLINQDAASGALTPAQANALRNREAQIQAQQQQYMNQNGGTLTPVEQRQIDSELRGLGKKINNDVRWDANQKNMTGLPGSAPAWQYGYPGFQRYQWQNSVGQQYLPPPGQNGMLGQVQIANPPQFQPPPYGQHHHHNWNNGYGVDGGYGNGFVNNHGNGFVSGNGYVSGNAYGNGYGNGYGSGNAYGNGYGHGYGSGNAYGNGYGHGDHHGDNHGDGNNWQH